MTKFDFFTNSESYSFCREILEVIVGCSEKSRAEAVTMLNKYWGDLTDVEEEFRLYAETPYYWAMCIIHHPTIGDNNPEWYLDEKFMPPPDWIKKRYYYFGD